VGGRSANARTSSYAVPGPLDSATRRRPSIRGTTPVRPCAHSVIAPGMVQMKHEPQEPRASTALVPTDQRAPYPVGHWPADEPGKAYDAAVNAERRAIAKWELRGAFAMFAAVLAIIGLLLAQRIGVPEFVAAMFATAGIGALLLNNARRDTIPYQLIYSKSGNDPEQTHSVFIEGLRAAIKAISEKKE
jgi:hypothetical protein